VRFCFEKKNSEVFAENGKSPNDSTVNLGRPPFAIPLQLIAFLPPQQISDPTVIVIVAPKSEEKILEASTSK
jgi:hypothetical protein